MTALGKPLKDEHRSRVDLAGIRAQRILTALDDGQEHACAGRLLKARARLRGAREDVAALDGLIQALLADMAALERIADGITGERCDATYCLNTCPVYLARGVHP